MTQELDSGILESVKTSLLDSGLRSEERLRPKIVYNDVSSGKDVRTVLIDELEACDSYDFSVAFITKDGIASIAQALLCEGKRGRILTTDYQSFNDPEMFRYLMKQQGLFQVKVCSDLHTKGYIFHHADGDTMLIGSSNLTQYALKQNHEWNLRITSSEDGELLRDTNREFNRLWDSAHELSEDWIAQYAETFEEERVRRREESRRWADEEVHPNSMQADALEILQRMRDEGKRRALVIAATGTGKTYLSAFDVQRFRPARMLFLVHRENILDAALKSFRNVIHNGAAYGKYTGAVKEPDADYLFASVQSMSRHLDEFPSNHFDYIVCDEIHHLVPRADDNSEDRQVRNMYSRIIEHFKPGFMLGMTATPERTDGANIYEVFDYNIAQEVRLKDALEADLLCPFHYFGISDLTVDGESMDDKTDFSRLVSDERVRHIRDAVETYPHSGNLHKGLMFCSRVEECRVLSEKLNAVGYRTVALSADNTIEERETAVRRLQSDGDDHIDFILTRDIFNEGVDIPKVNEIVLLRPTQSVIVYIQQLGRGLRKAEGKEFLTVLDFIGNYQNNYMIPVALYGDNTCNQDNVRRDMILNTIPGVSSVSFDRITRDRILESIGTGRIMRKSALMKRYIDLSNKLGRAPTLCDLYGQESIDPIVVVQQFGSLNAIRAKTKKGALELTKDQDSLLMFLSSYLVGGIRPYEAAVVSELMENTVSDRSRIAARIKGEYGIEPDADAIESAILILSDGYLVESEVKKYGHSRVLEDDGDRMRTSNRFASFILDRDRRALVRDITDCSSKIFNAQYKRTYDGRFSLYEKYSRADVCRLCNNSKNIYSTMYGYKFLSESNICPIFVNYNKDDTLNSMVKYEEGFVDRYTFRWATRTIAAKCDLNGRMDRSYSDKLEVRILDADENGMRLPLFVKKGISDNSDFYFLGWTHPVPDSDRVVYMADDNGIKKPVMTVELRLEQPVDEKIYRYLTAPVDLSE